MNKPWDVIIIGSGISSLTAAALLGKKGKSVLVLERYEKPGGYLHCFERFGSTFDTGGHYVGSLMPGQPFRVLLEYLGAWRDDIFVPLCEDGFDIFRFPSFQVELSWGLERATEKVAEVFPEERDAIKRYFQLCTHVARKFPTYQFNDAVGIDSDLIKYMETPLSAVVESLTKNEKLKTFLYAYCVLHGVLPKDTPFGFHAAMTDSLLRGAHGFRHGAEKLADALVETIKTQGGKVLVDSGVKQLILKGDQITGVLTDQDQEFIGEWIISGAHPKNTFSLLSEDISRPIFKNRLANMQETVGFMGIYAVCRTPPPLAPNKNYYVFQSDDSSAYDKIMNYDPEDVHERPLALYAIRNSRTDAPNKRGFYPITLHAPGAYSWFAGWRDSKFGKRPKDYLQVKTELTENILKSAEEAWPGLRASMVTYSTSSPLSNIHYNGSTEGSPYGIYHSIQNTGARGLGPRTHIRNLLLTGQNTMFPGLLSSSISGLRTAGHILGLKPILRELREKTF